MDHPDIFILDKQLPGIDGLELCRILKGRKETAHLPVIVISAHPDMGKKAKEAGADDFMQKPFGIKEILKKIENLVKG